MSHVQLSYNNLPQATSVAVPQRSVLQRSVTLITLTTLLTLPTKKLKKYLKK